MQQCSRLFLLYNLPIKPPDCTIYRSCLILPLKDGRQSLSVAFPSLQIHFLALYHFANNTHSTSHLALSAPCSIAYLRRRAACVAHSPASQPLKQHLSSPPPAPLSLTSSWPTTPRVRLEECAAHERYAGAHPSLAEGYICTSRSSRIALPPSNPTPSYASSSCFALSPLTLAACRRMGGLQVHLDISGSSRAKRP